MAIDDVEKRTQSIAAETQQAEELDGYLSQSTEHPPQDEPFSIFSKREKWALIAMIGFAGFFSPMSANVYFPAIPLLSQDFGVSVSIMNLTVTVYLIFQGISPMFWAPLADVYGRRPVYLLCLSLLSLACIALALVPTDKWYLLIVFRCFQAAGSASTIALGSGVVSDIATPAERGGFLGWAIIGPLIGPCIGPFIGGVLAGNLGWRWIFWFLCIISAVCCLFILLFLPETLRLIVGNGSIPAPWYDRPLVPIIGPHRHRRPSSASSTPAAARPKPHRMNPFTFFREPDIIFMLLANGLVYAFFVTIQATTSLLLQDAYPYLTQSDVGLCFLPLGAGSVIGSVFTGKFLDWQYKKDRNKWETGRRRMRREQHNESDKGAVEVDAPWSKEEELTFPLEMARVKWGLAYTFLTVVVGIGYGWALDRKAHLAVPMILQFIGGYVVSGQMNSFQTLLMDSFPKQGSSTTAINNFVRCLLGAGITAVIELILNALGTGWTYTLVGGICGLFSPLCTVIVIRYGPQWRAARARRLEKRIR